jgi:hypothetical protein
METHCHTPLEREPLLIEHDLFVSIMEKMRSDRTIHPISTKRTATSDLTPLSTTDPNAWRWKCWASHDTGTFI